ncbi:MAG: site-specific tyrosine recombinase XerD [Galactobacter sp.]
MGRAAGGRRPTLTPQLGRAGNGAGNPPSDSGSDALRRGIDAYLNHLRVERGLSANTLAAYRRDLARYEAHLRGRDILAPQGIAAQDVTAFAAALGDGADGATTLAPRSAARCVVAVRGLHRFWAEESITAENVAVDVHPPSTGQRLPKALPLADVEALLAAPDPETPAGLRDRALLEFLYATGARVSEAVGLDVDDLHLEAPEDGGPAVVRLFGKGSKERVVPLGSYAVKALQAYLVRARGPLAAKGKGTPALFLNLRGGRLSRQSAFTIIRAAAERAGITREVSPHTLRHSFATHLIEGGADVRVVQELLGHASVTTTQVYTLVTADTLREVFLTSHPRAR